MMRKQTKVLEIANGKRSASRIARIYQGLYNEKINIKEVYEICQKNNIATPKGTNDNSLGSQYPDIYSVLLEAKSFWSRVRQIWGDDKAKELYEKIQKSKDFRSLLYQFEDYANGNIYDRKNIDFNFKKESSLPIEELYSFSEIKQQYLEAYRLQQSHNPEVKIGAEFPLPTPEYQRSREQKYIVDCIAQSRIKFPDSQAVINYFSEFWQAVRKNRGERYFEQLRSLVFGNFPDLNNPYYSKSETLFYCFLASLEGFKSNGRYYVVSGDLKNTVPMELRGLIEKSSSWTEVYSLVGFGLSEAVSF